MSLPEQLGEVCWLDTETTGLDPDRHQIWEVGLILPDGSEWSWQLPVDLARADVIALSIGRFHDRRGADLRDAHEADWAPELDRTLLGMSTGFVVPEDSMRRWATTFVDLTRGLHICGAVISFDERRLWDLLRDLGECGMWHYHIIDCEALAAGYLAGLRHDAAELPSGKPSDAQMEHQVNMQIARPPWNSNDLSRAVGVDPDTFERHSALGDARWAKAIYEAVMG